MVATWKTARDTQSITNCRPLLSARSPISGVDLFCPFCLYYVLPAQKSAGPMIICSVKIELQRQGRYANFGGEADMSVISKDSSTRWRKSDGPFLTEASSCVNDVSWMCVGAGVCRINKNRYAVVVVVAVLVAIGLNVLFYFDQSPYHPSWSPE